MRISDWSSDVCSSDLHAAGRGAVPVDALALAPIGGRCHVGLPFDDVADVAEQPGIENGVDRRAVVAGAVVQALHPGVPGRWIEIGRAHVCTPVTNAHLVCRLLLAKKKTIMIYSAVHS